MFEYKAKSQSAVIGYSQALLTNIGLGREKHSGLLWTFATYGHKKFHNPHLKATPQTFIPVIAEAAAK